MSEHKFSVGDKVKVRRHMAEVIGFNDIVDLPYTVRFEDGVSAWVHESSLEPVSDQQDDYGVSVNSNNIITEEDLKKPIPKSTTTTAQYTVDKKSISSKDDPFEALNSLTDEQWERIDRNMSAALEKIKKINDENNMYTKIARLEFDYISDEQKDHLIDIIKEAGYNIIYDYDYREFIIGESCTRESVYKTLKREE